jgi:hypothetical protein
MGQMEEIENQSKIDIDLIDEVLAYKEHYLTYQDAPDFQKTLFKVLL